MTVIDSCSPGYYWSLWFRHLCPPTTVRKIPEPRFICVWTHVRLSSHCEDLPSPFPPCPWFLSPPFLVILITVSTFSFQNVSAKFHLWFSSCSLSVMILSKIKKWLHLLLHFFQICIQDTSCSCVGVHGFVLFCFSDLIKSILRFSWVSIIIAKCSHRKNINVFVPRKEVSSRYEI